MKQATAVVILRDSSVVMPHLRGCAILCIHCANAVCFWHVLACVRARLSSRAAQASLERVTQQELAQNAGVRLAQVGSSRSLAKAIPVIGAAVSGAIEVLAVCAAALPLHATRVHT